MINCWICCGWLARICQSRSRAVVIQNNRKLVLPDYVSVSAFELCDQLHWIWANFAHILSVYCELICCLIIRKDASIDGWVIVVNNAGNFQRRTYGLCWEGDESRVEWEWTRRVSNEDVIFQCGSNNRWIKTYCCICARIFQRKTELECFSRITRCDCGLESDSLFTESREIYWSKGKVSSTCDEACCSWRVTIAA